MPNAKQCRHLSLANTVKGSTPNKCVSDEREREREKKTQVELKVFLKNRVRSSLNQLKNPSPVSSKILHQLTDVLVLPSGPHNTCAARCQRDMPVPYPQKVTCFKIQRSLKAKLRKLRAQPKQIVSISSSNQPINPTPSLTFTCTALENYNIVGNGQYHCGFRF